MRLNQGQGCHFDDTLADQGCHQFANHACPNCGQDFCWHCAVRCDNDGTGDGDTACPHCGQVLGRWLDLLGR